MAYATSAELATWGVAVGDQPANVDTLLERASDLIDYVTVNGIDTDDDDHMAAAQNACCAQVEYWIEKGTDGEFEQAIRSKLVGRTMVVYAGNDGAPQLCKRAYRYLFLAGLLYRGTELT